MSEFAVDTRTVDVDGCVIAFHSLGVGPPIVLLHGGAAHSGWWRGVAPELARRHQVVSVDLGGHGDSGHRAEYNATLWADEVAAVLRASTSSPAAVVGHSMGGLIGLATAARWPELVHHLVLVDTRLPVRNLVPPPSTPRIFAAADEALGRFRLKPARTVADPSLLRAIAVAGLRETDGGWRWKFDPAARRRLTNERVQADLDALTCPVGYAYGTESDVGGSESLRYLERVLGQPVPSAAVPGAFHHVPLDQPEACAAAIEGLLAGVG